MATPGTTSTHHDVDLLVGQLKALPLIDSANLDAPFAAYEAFELVLSAITRAALVQVADGKRRNNNARLFKKFVVEYFPVGRGRGDVAFANRLWEFRCDFLKGKQTGQFVLTHNHPELHWQRARDARLLLNLQSLIADFRQAVDLLGGLLRSTPDMLEVAHNELASRAVQLVPVVLPRSGGGAQAATGTGSQ